MLRQRAISSTRALAASLSNARMSSKAALPPPLFHLDGALFDDLHESASPLSLTINDRSSELWAVIAPHSSSSSGSKLLTKLLSTLVSRSRPQQVQVNSTSRLHPSPHLFTTNASLIALASFSKQQVTSNAGFQDFSARYGALREEDTVTVFESLMEAQGFEVGKVAAMKVLPDLLNDAAADEADRAKATAAKERIERLAPLLGLHQPGPGSLGGVPLLYSPVISLSNGQLRRARIVSSLVRLDEATSNVSETGSHKSLLVLDQPYSGLDEGSREELTDLLSKLHGSGAPRVVLVLRRQDEVPGVVTHIVDVDTDGRVWTGSRDEWGDKGHIRPRGVDGIRQNREGGVGIGMGRELARLVGATVQYGEKVVLNAVDLTLREQSRLIIKGANGSGKTTLLSLLNGSHPQSYSFSPDTYTLFGKARSAPSNATRLLSQRIGYFGPDLLASFPRRGLESGGLSIKDAVACGFQGLFSRVNLTPEEEERVEALLLAFRDCISFRDQGWRERESSGVVWWNRSFIELDSASQSITLFLRAVVGRPSILILDEPFQGMDAVQINRVRHYIDSLGQPDGYLFGSTPDARRRDAEKAAQCAVVLVSHYINEWPDRMGEYMLLDNGQVIDQI